MAQVGSSHGFSPSPIPVPIAPLIAIFFHDLPHIDPLFPHALNLILPLLQCLKRPRDPSRLAQAVTCCIQPIALLASLRLVPLRPTQCCACVLCLDGLALVTLYVTGTGAPHLSYFFSYHF